MIQKIAKIIIDAANIRENSFDKEAATQCRKIAERSNDVIIDYNVFYEMSVMDACKKACEQNGASEDLASLVYLMLEYCWNDVVDWAWPYVDENTKAAATR